MREYMTDKEINDLIDKIIEMPEEQNNNCLSTYGSINVYGLIDSIKELRKVPTYDELLRESKKLKKEKKELIDYLKEQIKEYTPNLRLNKFDEDGNRVAQYINTEIFTKQPVEVYKEILSKIEKE